MSQPSPAPVRAPFARNHRAAAALERRLNMRGRILEATLHVFADRTSAYPVIEDVVREAGVSRATFYKHFKSLDDALIAAGTEASDRMMVDMLPVYDFLAEPWQRFSVGYRLYLIRALLDRHWARFVTRMEMWPHASLVAHYMREDLDKGRQAGQFHFNDLDAATDLLMGGCAGCIHALLCGVPDPHAYVNACVALGLQAAGVAGELNRRAAEFSLRHLGPVLSGEQVIWQPILPRRAEPAR